MEFQKNQICEITIEDMGKDGEGIGKKDGYPLFVKDALIGDKAKVRITKVKKQYAYARLEELLESSPFRTEPKCAYHRQCGGCQIQAMEYQAQLAFKQKKVWNNLHRIGGFSEALLEQAMEPIVGMKEPWHYRNKAQFPIGTDQQGRPIAGFYAGRTHYIIANTDCALGAPENRQVLEIVLAYMRQYNVPAYNEETGRGLLRHVLIRKGFASGQTMVCLVAAKENLPQESKLVSRLCEVPGMASVCLNVNSEHTNVILGSRTRLLWGSAVIEDSIRILKRKPKDGQRMIDHEESGCGVSADSCKACGHATLFEDSGESVTFRISAQSFYQINPEQTEKLYSIALEYAGLTGTETVWDLYCGIGTISLFLAKHAGKVYGVETVAQAVQDAKENARLNHIENAVFVEGKAEEILPAFYAGDTSAAEVLRSAGQPAGRGAVFADDKAGEAAGDMRHPDVIVVDPPRKGCDRSCLDTMLHMAPERIVYVSCDSATLARDLKILCEGGYELKRVCPVDQFAHTVHTETCVLLTHKKPTSYIEVTMDYDKIVPEYKPKHATYKEITDYVWEKYGLKVKSTTIAEVKRSFGFEVGDYNNRSSTNYRREKITPEKRQAVEDAMRHFGMIK